MSFSPIQSAGWPGPRNQTPRADDGRRPGAAPNRRAWKQVSANGTRSTRAAGSPCSPASYGEIYADVPTQCLDAPASAKSTLAQRTPQKHSAPECWSLIGWLQQQSGVQTQFWSVPFIGDSLLQVNRNCLGRASNAVEHSLGKGEVVSFNPYRQPHFYWLSSTSSLTQLCNSVRNDPGTCGSGRRGNFDSLPLRSPSLHAAVALGVDFRKLRAEQKYLR
jgi:hypothetical protein